MKTDSEERLPCPIVPLCKLAFSVWRGARVARVLGNVKLPGCLLTFDNCPPGQERDVALRPSVPVMRWDCDTRFAQGLCVLGAMLLFGLE